MIYMSKRFREIVSTQKIVDTYTDIEYNGLVDDELLMLINDIVDFPICFICEYCFRDDWYGVCCENKQSPYYTMSWDLDYDNIKICQCFKKWE